ncbi:MAG: hypothetical protein GW946_02240 [Candidatus Pacebacteria bacterium]|nr:hypothetical protein [Candidatus Paceibacterota bacterium]PIR60379.1 MAG: hypothetical protein COU67_02385 [Candidatus Pacebacteria bacterium CG10_big_fil_rev_8_21_14_0_10_44_54]
MKRGIISLSKQEVFELSKLSKKFDSEPNDLQEITNYQFSADEANSILDRLSPPQEASAAENTARAKLSSFLAS